MTEPATRIVLLSTVSLNTTPVAVVFPTLVIVTRYPRTSPGETTPLLSLSEDSASTFGSTIETNGIGVFVGVVCGSGVSVSVATGVRDERGVLVGPLSLVGRGVLEAPGVFEGPGGSVGPDPLVLEGRGVADGPEVRLGLGPEVAVSACCSITGGPSCAKVTPAGNILHSNPPTRSTKAML